MSIQILPQQGSIAGRIGKGLGQGLSEQLPKEIERYRLSQGLQDFEKGSQDLTPLQQYTRLAQIPGITPAMLQAFPEILNRQAQAQSLTRGISGQGQNKEPSPRFPSIGKSQGIEPSQRPSITTTEPTRATIESYIPKTQEQILQRAGELFNANPGLYKNDPNAAIESSYKEDAQNQAVNQAQQARRNAQQDVQTRVQNELKTQAQNAGVDIPDNVYSQIEDEALNAVKTGELTELQAAKKSKEKLDSISRDYKSIDTIGTAKVFSRTASGNKDALKSLRKKFKDRDDLENFADKMIAKNSLSPSKAYYLAYPVSDIKELNNEIFNIPKIQETRSEDPETETLKISPKLAEKMGKEGSPLAIAEEIQAKGYDPNVWLNYVDKNRKKLGITESQGRQLDKPRSFIPTLNDLWMFMLSGLDKIVEQK